MSNNSMSADEANRIIQTDLEEEAFRDRDADQFIREMIILCPVLSHCPTVVSEIKARFLNPRYSVYELTKDVVGTFCKDHFTESESYTFRKLNAVQEILDERDKVLFSVIESLSQNPDPHVQGVVSGLQDYLSGFFDE